MEKEQHVQEIDLEPLCQALLDSQELLLRIQQLGRIGTWEYHLETREIIWSDETYKLFRCEKTSCPPSVEEETWHYSDNQVSVLMYPEKDQKGRIHKLTGTIQDITVRKQAEKARYMSEEFNRTIIESSNDCIKVLALDGTLLSMNKGGQILMEIEDLSQVLNKPWIDFWSKTDELMVHNEVVKAIRGETGHFQAFCHTAKGTPKWWDVLITPIRNDTGGIEKLLSVSRDVTERVESENHIRELNASLEQAWQKAEESDRLKSSLLNNMSHEFRTPMNAILGFSSLMENDASDSEVGTMAHRINTAGTRLMRTLDDMLELAMLKAGNVEEMKKSLNLYDEVVALLPGYREAAGRNQLQLNFKGQEDLLVSMTKHHFKRVLDHLVENAIKFTAMGGITIELNKRATDSKSWIEIKVSDSGIGINREHLGLIFEEFRQASEGYGRTYEGTGLGLTIANQIVELYGGVIRVESEVGTGTHFTILLPAVAEVIQKIKEVNQVTVGVEELSSLIRRESPVAKTEDRILKILVVEDNIDNVDVIRLQLNELASIDVASNGDVAIKKSRENLYDLILMDIHLGAGKNGLDATQQIRKIPAYELIPIIAVTGYTTDADKERIFQAGCNHYLGKPFSKEQLLGKIKEAIQ